ncbi:hypothetical protein CYMTET_37034 [Cymbomonas tetramitiformis]|uniref:Uncharacterized protein n=1 Tax=Cymbomonas tetramitiformis TaxID=36881 RepID=A0AAE0CG62_9CHLO|nr:hypothetical protein CYMTET_37034 [Cymbomonas tetramitiformis]
MEQTNAELQDHTSRLVALDGNLEELKLQCDTAIVETADLHAHLSVSSDRLQGLLDTTSNRLEHLEASLNAKTDRLEELIRTTTEQMSVTYVKSDEFNRKLEEALDDRTPQEDVGGAQQALPASFSGWLPGAQ